MIALKPQDVSERFSLIDTALARNLCVISSVAGLLIIDSKSTASMLMHALAQRVAERIVEDSMLVCSGLDERDIKVIGFGFNTAACTLLYGVPEEEFMAELNALGEFEPIGKLN